MSSKKDAAAENQPPRPFSAYNRLEQRTAKLPITVAVGSSSAGRGGVAFRALARRLAVITLFGAFMMLAVRVRLGSRRAIGGTARLVGVLGKNEAAKGQRKDERQGNHESAFHSSILLRKVDRVPFC